MNSPFPFEDIEKALAASDAGDTFTTDASGKAVRDEPRSLDEIEADDRALDERVIASAHSA